ncbi:DnaJ-domain-containing protein [Teratosphaeria destructans]|uniref:DnaJ-domain-containing protein n=1 Tax=Teratosphaeria destructans TaxID=418781 RepID=A0A9W7SXM2_9PEZI|nr:DnaJ-domain-containing protein [Teratosphaeria destructans]
MPDHYATLELPTNATASEIKKQFYKLSKAYHPDLHRDDPSSSQKFVQISEAHATLGSASGAGPSSHPSGSYSSASQPAGSRPPSGLSRRRTQFRGPPPSFYRSGGWGDHGDKRSEHASRASHSHEAQGRAQSGPGGTGPGGFTSGFDNDVRHFDQQGHYRTHSGIERTRHKARRKRYPISEDDIAAAATGGTSTLVNFVVISGVLGLGFLGAGAVWRLGNTDRGSMRKKKDDS